MIKNLLVYALRRIQFNRLKKLNHLIVGKNCIIINTVFGGNNTINGNVVLKGCSVGELTYFGSNCYFYMSKIGKYCSIGPNVNVAVGNHPIHDFVSTHPLFFSTRVWGGGEPQILQEIAI